MLALKLLLWTSFAAILLAFLHALGWLARGDERWLRRGRVLLWVGAGGLTLLMVALGWAFIASRMDLHYVWKFSDVSYAWWQRLSGFWIGREGSLLLWVWLATLWVAGEQFVEHRSEGRGGTPGRPYRETDAPAGDGWLDRAERGRSATAWAFVIGTGVLLVFLTVLLTFDFLGPTPAGSFPPTGRGVNPQLLTFYNFIHPPVLFTGYSLCLLPAAAAASHLVTGGGPWTRIANGWVHGAFLFLTAGIGLGGIWAYTTLGWGGYWAWDPVETASLVPWILVTGFLHAMMRADRGDYPLAAPAMGFLTFAGVLFSTLVVRAGGVWQSVHSFLGEGSAPSAWDRYVTALSGNPEVKGYTLLMALMLVSFVPLMMAHLKRVEDREADLASRARMGSMGGAFVGLLSAAGAGLGPERAGTDADGPSRDPAAPAADHAAPRRASLPRRALDRFVSFLTLSNAFLVAVMLFAIAATVIVTILIVGANGFASDDARIDIFQTRTAPIALSLAVAMSIGLAIGSIPKRRIPTMLAVMAMLAIAGALLFRPHWALGAAVPVLTTAIVLSVARLTRAFRIRDRRNALRVLSIHVIHLGVMTLLLGHGLVSTFETQHPGVELAVGESRTVGGDTFRLEELRVIDADGNGRAERVEAVLHIQRDGKDLGETVAAYQYYSFNDFYRPGVGIRSWLSRDIYVIPRGLHDAEQGWIFSNLPLVLQGKQVASHNVDRINIEVMDIPYLRIVWTGWGLMVLGALLRVGATLARPPLRRAPKNPI